MSDSDSSSDGEDLTTAGLVATRAKRATAGNLYATLRQNLDDEELQKELLAEEEEDAEDYEGSDRDDDDAMSSSSDEDDAGPPKEGDKEDLEGEKELKRQERAQQKKKRKMEEAKLRLPAWQKKKKVKLADDAKTEDGEPVKPTKKSDRQSWLPAEGDRPVRQSSRASAITNREIVHAHLQDSIQRSEKQKKVMAQHAEKSKSKARAELTQEERFAKAAKIEKETARDFGRWEREEAERQRIREEQLAAKRNRGIDGPFIRYWSGSVLWEGDKIKNNRMHGSQSLEDLEKEAPEDGKLEDGESTGEGSLIAVSNLAASTEQPTANASLDAPTGTTDQATANASLVTPTGTTEQPTGNAFSAVQPSMSTVVAEQPTTNASPAPRGVPATPGFAGSQPLQPSVSTLQPPPSQPPALQPSWLDGIHEYANQADPSSVAAAPSNIPPQQTCAYTPSAPSINVPPKAPENLPHPGTHVKTEGSQSQQPSVYHGWPTGYSQFQTQTAQQPATAQPPPPPAPPLIKEQAQRSLIMLEQFEGLEVVATTSKRGSTRSSKDARLLEPTAIASKLLPLSYPSFNEEETRYLTAKLKKTKAPKDVLPPAPVKTRCALTGWPAKFRDPKTGLPYAGLMEYKMVHRLLAGGCQWSAMLGCWVGPAYGSMGRPAKGVPDAFGLSLANQPAPPLEDAADKVKIESMS